MTFKINRRDFLKTTGMIPALSILPSWPIRTLSRDDNLFAIDFVWQCKSPFEGHTGGNYSSCEGEEPSELDYQFGQPWLSRATLKTAAVLSCETKFSV